MTQLQILLSQGQMLLLIQLVTTIHDSVTYPSGVTWGESGLLLEMAWKKMEMAQLAKYLQPESFQLLFLILFKDWQDKLQNKCILHSITNPFFSI